MEYTYLLSICIILLSTKVFSIASRQAQLPQVVGALMAGLFFGPAVLGALTTRFLGFPFCIMPSDLLTRLAELGVIVIMFTAGMETNIKDLQETGKVGFIVALCGVLVPLGMGAGLMYLFDNQVTFVRALFVGAVLTATSVSITVETLKEIGKLSTRSGNTILAAALIDDILGLICLAVITGMAGARVNILLIFVRIIGFFVFVGLMGVVFYKFMVWSDRQQGERNLRRYPVLGFALCLFMGWAAEVVFGVADIIGAFAAGMIIAMSPKGQYIASKFDTIAYLLLTPVFFANIGLGVSIPHMSLKLVGFTAALVAIGVLSKLGGCGLGARLCGASKHQSYQIGLGMVCRGEVALIIAGKGMAMGMLREEYLGPIILMIITCTIFTPIFLKRAFRGENAKATNYHLADQFALAEQVDLLTNDLIRHDTKRHEIHWKEFMEI